MIYYLARIVVLLGDLLSGVRADHELLLALGVQVNRMEKRVMAEQDDINALTDKINSDNTAIQSALADLEAKVAAGTVTHADLSALQAAVGGLDATAASAPQPVVVDPPAPADPPVDPAPVDPPGTVTPAP